MGTIEQRKGTAKMNNVEIYLALIAKAFNVASVENIEAVEAFEAANPEVVDDAYQAAGPMSYEVVSGVVTALDDMPTLTDCFGCDPWDEDNHGKHSASAERGAA